MEQRHPCTVLWQRTHDFKCHTCLRLLPPPRMFELRLAGAEISICEPDVRVSVETPSATPNDILYNQQWNMRAINAPGAWQTGQFGDPKQQVSDRRCC